MDKDPIIEAPTDKDDASMDKVPNDVPIDVDDDRTQPDEGDIPETPEEGDASKPHIGETPSKTPDGEEDAKKTSTTFQTEIPAEKHRTSINQLTPSLLVWVRQLARNPRFLSSPHLLPILPRPRWRN
jgi:hypothetical protein